jgi:AraC-like DNA-binding protein
LLDQQLAVSAQGWEIIRRLKGSPELQDLPILVYALPPGGTTGAVLELDYRTKPLSEEQLARILAQPTVGEQAPQTVLIVDDDANILSVHTRLIKAQLPDCRVLVAHHGREALDILQHTRPDLVLLDLMMPEVDGFGVLEAMRTQEATRDIAVIVLTAQALTESDMERLNRGVVAVLEKGVFSAEETLARVAATLTRTGRVGSTVQRLVRKSLAYIHAHYDEPITRELLASQLAVSGTYLSNCFQKELGISPMTYLNRYRIKQARALLELGEQSMTQVSLAVGFSDSAYFSRVFQREVGVSPSAYRRGQRKP